MGRHWINPAVGKPLNLNINDLFLNENNGGFGKLLSMSLIDTGQKKGPIPFWNGPHTCLRRQARKEGYEERSLSRFFF